jgi:hypothetical protein
MRRELTSRGALGRETKGKSSSTEALAKTVEIRNALRARPPVFENAAPGRAGHGSGLSPSALTPESARNWRDSCQTHEVCRLRFFVLPVSRPQPRRSAVNRNAAVLGRESGGVSVYSLATGMPRAGLWRLASDG